MLLSSAIFKAFKASPNCEILWSNIHDLAFDKRNVHIDMVEIWETTNHPNEFKELYMDHPKYGVILYDSKHRPRIVHSIRFEVNNHYYGVIPNETTTPPIEFEMIPAVLAKTVSIMPDPSNLNAKLAHCDTSSEGDNKTPTDDFSWEEMEKCTSLPSKQNSFMPTHPTITSLLLQSTQPLDRCEIEMKMKLLFGSLVNTLPEQLRNKQAAQRLFTYLNLIPRALDLREPIRIFFDTPVDSISGENHINAFLPEGMRVKISPDVRPTPAATPRTRKIITPKITAPDTDSDDDSDDESVRFDPRMKAKRSRPVTIIEPGDNIDLDDIDSINWDEEEEENRAMEKLRKKKQALKTSTIIKYKEPRKLQTSVPALNPFLSESSSTSSHHPTRLSFLQPINYRTPPTYDPRKTSKKADCRVVQHYHQPQPQSAPNKWLQWESGETSGSSGKKKNLFANLTFANRMLLCWISATAFNQPDPAHPSPTCWDLFNDSTSSKVPTHVLSYIRQAGARGS
jgi:hypothetical protein